MIETAFTRSFGITAPVVEAPVAPEPALVAAVSNAGGLGLLWTKELDPESVAATVRATRELTDRPFGVNFALDEPRDQQLDAALAALKLS